MAEYISREAFKARIREQQKKCASPDEIAAFTVFSFLLQAVDEEPAADVQPVKHGRWIEHINRRYDYDREQGDIGAGVSYTCSLCDLHGLKAWHFCPNCGARMDGEQNVDKEV